MAESTIVQELMQGNEELKWFSENYEKLRSKFKNKFIALRGKRVVMESKRMEDLVNELSKKYGNIEDFRIEFMPDDEFVLVV